MSSELQNNFSRLALSSNQHQRIPSTSTLPSFLYEQQQADSRHFGSLIVVSNRLPVSLEQPVSELKGGEKPSFKQSSGGLVTALTGMKRKFKWLGWLGNEISDASVQESVKTELKSKYNCYPVFLDQKEADDYYNGFSNGILWPLFHYLFSEKNTVFNEKQWEAYKKVNEDFAKAILDIYQEGDLVWVHDYHLMLVPSLLRKARPNIYISFFLHIPFPSSEIYRMLPVRSELLEGVLACNLIGFHTHNFARHFLSSCTRILGAETSPKGLIHNGLSVNVQVFPIGINPRQFTDCVQTKETQERITYFREKYKDKKVILGIDRLDYTKGIELKLKAFEKFLASYPEHKKNTILLQVGVPTREAVKEYQDLISTTNQLVGKINSTHGTLDGFPVHYINKSVNFTDLCALYSIADALVVTSVRDGMNLVSCEYVVCQDASGGNGVLMLSEFAGAAASLGGSIILNPFDVELTAKAFAQAIEMDKEEKRVRHRQNYSIVSKNTAEKWGTDFITMFENACCEQANTVKLPKLSHSLLKSSYLKAQGSKRIFLLGYDGTLVPIKKYPALVFPPSKTLTALKQLAADPNNIVYILSARDRTSLEAIFNTIPQLGLAAEHGIFVRHPNSTTWTTLYHVEDFSLEWMRLISPILEHVEARTPGSFFEQKECSMAFHYRNAEAEYGEWQAKELALHLDLSFSSLPVEVLHGNKVLEIRPQGVSKGFAAQKILEKNLKDLKFVFCAGDDRSDEDMFNDTKCFFSHTVSPSASPQFKAILSRDTEFIDISSRRLSVDVTNMEDEAIQTRRYPGGLTVCTCLVGKTTGSKALCYLPSTTDLVEALDQMCK